jgi:hypothetical protein
MRRRKRVRLSLRNFEHAVLLGKIGGTALAPLYRMALALHRDSPSLTAVTVVVGGYLLARTVNTFVGAALVPGPILQDTRPAPTPATQAHPMELDVGKAAKLFDVAPRDEPSGVAAPSRHPGVWNAIPIRSSLRGAVIGTAIADPSRYSLCQIANPDLDKTAVYAVGDDYQGALIYGIEMDRVLLDRKGVNEYLERGAPAVDRSPVSSVLTRTELNRALNNLPELSTKARIVPSFDGSTGTRSTAP